ncbi:ADP-forming succinate--CoA ligase subunit beta [Candidatus Methylopumilus universalis]|uniref:Succinate--CoA ligase [ADP-forming] subunit beta n=1 Tax=Candidatus Methylopumilus universalis TaxID=2588536 RepID=A0AAX1EYK6_9PROT|nr:ADP-forming succinate--CoA ligase subunit beta [Candidatus Methylopumilus universalis]QDC40855.1 ADP-forming succinate--CoA ligase subunit beta [Candidatus Methylopumilus universalis]QDC42146.1 ADP-forming succinate--CoA ligase subunit beta [Candidatus Methylopumilus universalis]QDC54532.1 ADP-forming succinate--CoA ligase subunit beta [Candidatus Methylopumilus universalis]QDC55812.1 ADP-forming succinate--CoA ligase subunit beta [Candidatus Methylopumilus universalis]QDC57095.1 ADP-formin
MNLHEYQAKQLIAKYGISVPKGIAIKSPDELDQSIVQLASSAYVIKAQIHAGGRGKAGGVKIVTSKKEAAEVVNSLLHKKLVTYQNKPDGQPVDTLLIEESCDIEKELYFSILVDRQSEKIVVIASSAGGMEIEEISKNNPEKIIKETCSPINGLMDYQSRNIAFALGLPNEMINDFVKFARSAFKSFIENNLALLEINPLVIDSHKKIIALDCKINVDDNALYKQKTLAELRDWSQNDSKEAEAFAAGLNYIALNGNIGCMVNGAGLAMATMDLIKLCGGEPANFLDVGGGATAETVAKAFKIILDDKNVQVVLVNIFGGIMRCDIIAEGIIAAIKEVGIKIPIVVRLEGTNVDLGKKLLQTSGLNIKAANTLTEAATIATSLIKK